MHMNKLFLMFAAIFVVVPVNVVVLVVAVVVVVGLGAFHTIDVISTRVDYLGLDSDARRRFVVQVVAREALGRLV